MIAAWQHYANGLHMECRLVSLGLPHRPARIVARIVAGMVGRFIYRPKVQPEAMSFDDGLYL
jgi:hypothetical protein